MSIRYAPATHMRANIGFRPMPLLAGLCMGTRRLATGTMIDPLAGAQRPGFGIAPAMAVSGFMPAASLGAGFAGSPLLDCGVWQLLFEARQRLAPA